MFAGDIVEFNTNFSYVVRILYVASTSVVKSCSSAAISPTILLSAAHCFVDKPDEAILPDNIQLTVIGPYANEITFPVENAFIHPHYHPNRANDISLIRAATPLPVKPIDVSWNPIEVGRNNCLGAGYGSRYIHPFQGKLILPVLSWVRYPQDLMIPKSDCVLLRSIANENVICLLLYGGVGPCGGDSGGPMVCNGHLHALLSRGMILGGDNCGAARGILIYEEVHAYRDWIDKMVQYFETQSRAQGIINVSSLPHIALLTLYAALANYMNKCPSP